MLEGKAVVRETDIPEYMQCQVMEFAYQALNEHEVSDCQSVALFIKQKLDEKYGPAWNSVVGKDFGSCNAFRWKFYILPFGDDGISHLQGWKGLQ